MRNTSKTEESRKNLQMYVIMKLGYEAPIYDKLGFGANFKRRTESVV